MTVTVLVAEMMARMLTDAEATPLTTAEADARCVANARADEWTLANDEAARLRTAEARPELLADTVDVAEDRCRTIARAATVALTDAAAEM